MSTVHPLSLQLLCNTLQRFFDSDSDVVERAATFSDVGSGPEGAFVGSGVNVTLIPGKFAGFVGPRLSISVGVVDVPLLTRPLSIRQGIMEVTAAPPARR